MTFALLYLVVGAMANLIGALMSKQILPPALVIENTLVNALLWPLVFVAMIAEHYESEDTP